MEVESQQLPRKSPSKTSSQMAYFKSKNGKCQRPGPVGRNPYLNFLREFRKRNCGLSAVETIRRGAKEWKTLPKEKKLQYIEAAFYAPKRRRQTAPFPEDKSCCPKITCPTMKKKTNSCSRKAKKRTPKKSACRKRRRRRKNKCGKRKAKRARSSKKKSHGCKKRRKRKSCKC